MRDSPRPGHAPSAPTTPLRPVFSPPRRPTPSASTRTATRIPVSPSPTIRTRDHDVTDRGRRRLRARGDGPCTATACPSPDASGAASGAASTRHARSRCRAPTVRGRSPTVNADRRKPVLKRAGGSPPPGQISGADRGQAGEHGVELLRSAVWRYGSSARRRPWRGPPAYEVLGEPPLRFPGLPSHLQRTSE